MTSAFCAASISIFVMMLDLVAILLAGWRWTRALQGVTRAVNSETPPVSIIRPLCGIETFSEETLASTFAIEWPSYEILFCVQRATDPIIPMVEREIARNPGIRARLLVGDDPISSNPKLNNCVKGWNAVQHDWVAFTDSNVLMPPDYIARMMCRFDDRAGLVISMPLGTRPDGFFATVECAFLNTFQARWQYAVDAFGCGFAQGKNMMWRRSVLERAGGIAAMTQEVAEDAASTRIVWAQDLEVRLVDMPFEQPLGKRRARDVWSRHVRWARLRRVSFPWQFAPEVLTGGFVPLVTAAYAAKEFDVGIAATVATVAGLLYGSELLLAKLARFPLDWRTLPAMIARDLWLPVMYLDALLFDDFVWHGHEMTVRKETEEAAGKAG